MKTNFFTFLLLALPFLVSAQTLTIASGATVTVGPGASLTTGTLTNNAGVDGLVIQTDDQTPYTTGAIIFDNGTPDATVYRYVPEGNYAPGPPAVVTNWHFVSPPVTNATVNDFFVDTGHDAWLLSFDETVIPAENGWIPEIDPATFLSSGTGYTYVWTTNATRDMDNPGYVKFQGPLTAGTIAAPLSNVGNSFSLVGNPYSAPIDIIDLATDATDLEESYWIWDGASSQYHFFTTTTGQGYPGFDDLIGTVALGQAFFLKAIGPSPTANFEPESRITTPVEFYKKSNSDYFNHIKLVAFKGEKSDKIYVTFADDGSEDFENGYDASKLFGGATAPQLYMNVQDRQQSINYLATIQNKEELIVPFSFIAGEDGVQTLEVTTDYLIDTHVILEDTKIGHFAYIMKNPVYTFLASKQDNPDRFLLHFNSSALGIEDPEAGAEQLVNIHSWNKAVYISNNDNNYISVSTISITDMYGREIYNSITRLGTMTRIPLTISNSYVVVRVIQGSNVYTNNVYIK